MVTILTSSAKMAELGILKIKVFWNKVSDSNYVAALVMWPKCGDSCIYIREVTTISVL